MLLQVQLHVQTVLIKLNKKMGKWLLSLCDCTVHKTLDHRGPLDTVDSDGWIRYMHDCLVNSDQKLYNVRTFN